MFSCLKQFKDCIKLILLQFQIEALNVYFNEHRNFGTRNNNDNFGLDPVTNKPMTDPVIDQAGHTFDRSTINMLLNREEGKNPHCPVGKEVINVNRLVPNLLAKEAIERVNRGRSEIENARQLQQLPNEINELKGILNNVVTKIDKIESELSFARKQITNISEIVLLTNSRSLLDLL